MISVICESFNCTPDIALKQDPSLVREVLEYRTAQASADQFNDDASKMSPEMVRMMSQLREEIKDDGS